MNCDAPAAIATLIYTGDLSQNIMMREVKPLGDRQWAMVVEQLKKGPTPEMIRAVEQAKEDIKYIKEVDPHEFERRRAQASKV